MHTSARHCALRLLGFAVVCVGGAAPAAAIDWDAVADEETVVVVTADEDGTARETTVWLAVHDGQGYIRTGGTTWGSNVVRENRIQLRIGDAEHTLHAELVSDEELRAAITSRFREKYGLADRIISPFRGRSPKIMRLVEREEPAPAQPDAPDAPADSD